MSKGIPILFLALLGATGGLTWASWKGVGVQPPEKNPISIREGSTRIRRHGHYRTRYFVGGGLRGGK